MSKIACHAEVEEKEPNTLKIKRTLTAHKKNTASLHALIVATTLKCLWVQLHYLIKPQIVKFTHAVQTYHVLKRSLSVRWYSLSVHEAIQHLKEKKYIFPASFYIPGGLDS